MSLPAQAASQVPVSEAALAQVCRSWRVAELALFGSILRADFRPDSDVDLLVSFEPGVTWDLRDFARLQGELSRVFGRNVDLVLERALKNPFRRQEILRTKLPVYAA